jgi:hypothetical protein
MPEDSWVSPHILAAAEDNCGFHHVLVIENTPSILETVEDLGFPLPSNGRYFGFSAIF